MRSVVVVSEAFESHARLEPAANGRSLETPYPVLACEPTDLQAVDLAVRLRERYGGGVVAIQLGPSTRHRALRTCLAMGANQAWLIDDPAFADCDAHGQATVLARAIQHLSADLILTGHSSSLRARGGNLAALLAARLGTPVARRVAEARADAEQGWLKLICGVDRGRQREVGCPLPAVLTVALPGWVPAYLPLPAMIAATTATVYAFDRATLDLPEDFARQHPPRVETLGYSARRPGHTRGAFFTPDAKWPAHQRLLSVVTGGVTDQRGDWVEGEPQAVVRKILGFLRQQGINLAGE